MATELLTSEAANRPPTPVPAPTLLSTTGSSAGDDAGSSAPSSPAVAQWLQTEDVEPEPSNAVLWATAPSQRHFDLTATASDAGSPVLQYGAADNEPVVLDDRKSVLPPTDCNPHDDAALNARLPPPQHTPAPHPSTKTVAATSASAGDNLRARMQHALVNEDDSDDDGDAAARRPVLKKFGAVAAGKYKVAADSDGDESDGAQDVLVVEHDDDFLEIESILKKTRVASAVQQAQAIEVAAAHAEDMWKPISMWSEAKPASKVKSAIESSVHLPDNDLQLLQLAMTSPARNTASLRLRPVAQAPAHAPTRMTQLPPERKWPLSRAFLVKSEGKALAAVQLTRGDAQHLQDIENCIAEGGRLTDELHEVRSKLRKLQPSSSPSRASTLLKSSHTLDSSELRSMMGAAPLRNPFLPPNYRSGRQESARDAVPYDCIRLLQSYDTAAGTAQRLLEHDRMMSDLYYALKAEAQYDLVTGETVLGDGSGRVQQLLQDSVQDLTQELRAEVAVMDGDHVHLKPVHSVSHGSPAPSSKARSYKAASVASSTLASSARSSHAPARCVSESSRDAMWLGVWGRLAALHESSPANADFWQQLALLYPEAFAAISKLEDDAWSKMVQRSYLLAMNDFLDVLQLRESHCSGHYDECVPFIEKFIFLCNVFALECTACSAISDAYQLLKLALNVNVPPGVRFRNGRILRVLTYTSMASLYRRRKKLNAALKMMMRAQQLEARMPLATCRSFNWNLRPGPSPLTLLHTGCLLSQLSRKREAALAWSEALALVDQMQRNICTVEPTSRFLWKLVPPALYKSFVANLSPLCKSSDEIFVADGRRSGLSTAHASARSALSTAHTHQSQRYSADALSPEASVLFLMRWNSLACVSAEVFAALHNLASAHEQAMRHDISAVLHIQCVCSAVKNWGLPYMHEVTDVRALDVSGAQVVTLVEQDKDAPGWSANVLRCLRSCLVTQLKRQGMSRVVQHLLDAGLPLQAATQLSLWAQKHEPSLANARNTLPRPASAETEFDAASALDAVRPVSAVSKLRAISTASSSRPRSSIGMSRNLSPIANHVAAAATGTPSLSQPKPPRTPVASVTSSTPTNIIVRSFRDIEHRSQLLQRAKTSSARLDISSQPLVIQNVPARLRTQGALSDAASPSTRQKSPPRGGIGLAGLLSKSGNYYSDEDEGVEEISSEDEHSRGGLSLLQAAHNRERSLSR